MKKRTMILVYVLVCFLLFTGCAGPKGSQDTNRENSVEIDDSELAAETEPDTAEDSGSVSLPDGFTYSLKDPDHADSIVVTQRE